MARWISLVFVAAMLQLSSQLSRADVGDVSFRVSSTEVSIAAGASEGVATSVDVFLEIEGGGTIPATGWAAIFEITPAIGAIGSIAFDPSPIINSEPNLPVASQNPFVDFDRDFGGRSYGELGETALELHAIAAYVPPTILSPPVLDATGNLTLSDGAGLVSLPLLIGPDASGDFVISVTADPQLSSVLALNSDPPPDNTIIHSVGIHMAGTVSVERVLTLDGDYNADGSVDAADYIVWRKTDGTPAGHNLWRTNFGRSGSPPAALGDFNADGNVEAADYVVWRKTDGSPASYNVWRTNFGHTVSSGATVSTGNLALVPEPTSLSLILAGIVVGWLRVRRMRL